MRRKDKMKEYRNAVFVGFDEHGVARHAHKRSLYSKGKSYRGNVAGSDPRYSFHWTGTSNQLYVFEAPIDLLAFLSLHPTGWKSHSYVALCGTGEQAMLWMLKQSPALPRTRMAIPSRKGTSSPYSNWFRNCWFPVRSKEKTSISFSWISCRKTTRPRCWPVLRSPPPTRL